MFRKQNEHCWYWFSYFLANLNLHSNMKIDLIYKKKLYLKSWKPFHRNTATKLLHSILPVLQMEKSQNGPLHLRKSFHILSLFLQFF